MIYNQSHHNMYWYASPFHSTILIWQNKYFLNTKYNNFILALLHHFCHQTHSIYWLVSICLGTVSDNQYQIFFQCTAWWLSNSNNFFHYYKITICQAKNFKTMKNNLEKHIAPFPWIIIMNEPNCFGEFVISRNTYGLSRQYSGLKNFPHPRVYVHPHEISIHSSLISTK